MINEITVQRLRKIVCFAYNNSPFYHDLYNKAGVNVEICQLPDELPFLRADDIVQNSLRIKSNIPLYRVCASSGTKRLPKLLFRTQSDFSCSVRNQIKLMEWCGLNEADIIGIVQPSGLWGYADLTQEAARQMNILSIQLGNVEDEMALKLIHEIGVTVLDIAPSRLYSLFILAEQIGYRLGKVKIAMCSGEILSEELRQYAWRKFNIKIYNQYGSEETDALGGEKYPGKGIKLLNDSFLFEIRKEDNDFAKDGETGTLTVSSLYHQGTPLIRYQIEDRVRVISQKEGIVEILGRNEDYIVLYDSVKLHVSHLQIILNGYLNEPSAWQARVQMQNGKIIILICLQGHIAEKKKESLLRELPKASIDIYDLWKNGIIMFVVHYGEIKRTGRGKQIHLLDERSRKGVVQINN